MQALGLAQAVRDVTGTVSGVLGLASDAVEIGNFSLGGSRLKAEHKYNVRSMKIAAKEEALGSIKEDLVKMEIQRYKDKMLNKTKDKAKAKPGRRKIT